MWVLFLWGGFLSRALASVGSISAYVMSNFAATLVLTNGKAMASHANELRTDIRAVEMTGDINTYTTVLSKLYTDLKKSFSPFTRKMYNLSAPLHSHPSSEVREQWIRKATGNTQDKSQ